MIFSLLLRYFLNWKSFFWQANLISPRFFLHTLSFSTLLFENHLLLLGFCPFWCNILFPTLFGVGYAVFWISKCRFSKNSAKMFVFALFCSFFCLKISKSSALTAFAFVIVHILWHLKSVEKYREFVFSVEIFGILRKNRRFCLFSSIFHLTESFFIFVGGVWCLTRIFAFAYFGSASSAVSVCIQAFSATARQMSRICAASSACVPALSESMCGVRPYLTIVSAKGSNSGP